MKPSSMDLRERLAQAVDQKEGSLRQLARRFWGRLSLITRWLALRRQSGRMTVWRTLRRLRIRRKKKILYADEPNRPEVPRPPFQQERTW